MRTILLWVRNMGGVGCLLFTECMIGYAATVLWNRDKAGFALVVIMGLLILVATADIVLHCL